MWRVTGHLGHPRRRGAGMENHGSTPSLRLRPRLAYREVFVIVLLKSSDPFVGIIGDFA